MYLGHVVLNQDVDAIYTSLDFLHLLRVLYFVRDRGGRSISDQRPFLRNENDFVDGSKAQLLILTIYSKAGASLFAIGICVRIYYFGLYTEGNVLQTVSLYITLCFEL